MSETQTTLDQLEFRLSGGEDNTNPFQSLGGEMSNALPQCKIVDGVFDNLWDDITVQERLAGETAYRWIYFFNNSVETLYSVHLYFAPADEFISATWIKSGPMIEPVQQPTEYIQPSPDEIGQSTDAFPPFTGITDSFETTHEVTDIIGPLQWQAICIRRTIPPNTDSSLQRQYRLVVESRV
jgi:hypothetical protein